MEEQMELTSTGLTHSPEIGELAKAMAAARKKFKTVKKDTINPFFKSKYADLAGVIEATETALAENDLIVVQSPRFNGQTITVTTMLLHGSGQWLRDDLQMPMSKFDAQGAGSAITYARRYSYQSFVNVAAEADDDGNAASGKEKAAQEATMPKPPLRSKNGEDINPAAAFSKLFWAKAKAKGKTEIAVREYIGSIGYESTTEIPPLLQHDALAWADGTL